MACAALAVACARGGATDEGPEPARAASDSRREAVRPGITVLLDDSVHLVRGRRIGLVTNQTGVNERGVPDIDLLFSDPRATGAGARLVALFAPEHGIRGTEDREFVESGTDAKTGLPIHSLYGANTIAPPDSTLRDLDVLVVDLQDIGTRTWTYVGVVLYSMRAAARRQLPIVVLDRPNPITGSRMDGPMLDSAIANSEEHTATRPGRAYALYPTPLRHGMTMGELARMFNEELRIGADLHVVPALGWRRDRWFDETGLRWVRPSPNMPSLTSALLYPAIVAFEGSNLSVGRGTPDAFQHVGAPWRDAPAAVRLLEERGLAGVRFQAERFTPRDPTDRKFGGQEIAAIHISVTDRDRVQVGRVAAALLWAIAKTSRDSLRLTPLSVDLRLGSAAVREALMRGDDPDEVIDRDLPATVAFGQRARRFHIYR